MNAWDAKAKVGDMVKVSKTNSIMFGSVGVIVQMGGSPLGARPTWCMVDFVDGDTGWRFELVDLDASTPTGSKGT